MSLSHAILGFLQQQPMTGYDLKTQCFDASVAYFWPADQAQIYRTLDRLEEQGWAENKLEIQRDRPNRKVYQITQAGREELARWLVASQSLPIHREPFLVQLYFAAQLPNETIIALLEQQIAMHEALLYDYEQIPLPPVEAQGNGNRSLALARFTLDNGLRSEQTYLGWLRDTITYVRNLPASTNDHSQSCAILPTDSAEN